MRRIAGQAARHTGRLLHLLARLAETTLVVSAVAIGLLGWRLSQGPLDLPWLTHRVEEAINADGSVGHVTIGAAALAWEGFRLGVDRPIDIALTDVTFADARGKPVLAVPRGEISLSLHALLIGRMIPRALEIDGAHVSLIRAADGTFVTQPAETESAVDAGPLLAILSELTRPATSDQTAIRRSPLSQLRRVRMRDASIEVVDRQLGVTWRAPRAEIDLLRRPRGGVDGTAVLTLVLGDQRAQVNAAATLPPGKGPIRVRLRTTAISLASVARALPAATILSPLALPVAGEAELDLTDSMTLRAVHASLQAGKGSIHIAEGNLPISSASLVADATPDHVTLRSLRLELPSRPGAPPTVVEARGGGDRAADHLSAALSINFNQVTFDDLPRLWPAGVGAGARAWVTQNITAGTARDGHIEVGLAATPDLSDVTLTRATGSLTGEGLRVSWLAPVPPIEQGAAVLNILDPDTLEIVIRSGHQAPEKGTKSAGNLAIRGGKMRITGIMQPHQLGLLDADIEGSVPDAIALLRDPRLRLLSKHPLPLNDPAGQLTAHVSLSLPLEEAVTMDDIAIHARAHIQGAHLTGIVAGRDLDNGTLDLDASADGMTIKGRAELAGIPAAIDAGFEFRAGGPRQVLQRIGVQGRASSSQLAAAGFDVAPALDGPVGLTATLTEHRDGSGTVAVGVDLTAADLTVAPLGWHKPPGVAARAAARVVLSHDRLAAIDDVTLNGADLSGSAMVSCTDGLPSVIRINRLVLGRTDMHGTVRLPMAGGRAQDSIAATISGTTLDLASHFDDTKPPLTVKPKPKEPSGPHWTLDAHFDRVLTAGNHTVTGVSASMDSNGGLMRRLRLDGRTGPNEPIALEIASAGNQRSFHLTAADGGALLRAVDDIGRIQGGQLVVSGSFDDSKVTHPLSGTLELTDFRVRNAPVMARLLSGMTLYGLLDTMRGPGLGFSRLVMPFELANNTLTIHDARAFSPSLGLTTRGTIDFDLARADLQGTIVPAYFFNSLLGNIPLVGRLFSPEQGGGLFAASYAVHGALRNPDVTVNPLTALTPGFLRGVFGLF
jgi:hypothetical protein